VPCIQVTCFTVTNGHALSLNVCDLDKLSLEASAASPEGHTREEESSDEKFTVYLNCVSLYWLPGLTL
jgi:hypothetical protein